MIAFLYISNFQKLNIAWNSSNKIATPSPRTTPSETLILYRFLVHFGGSTCRCHFWKKIWLRAVSKGLCSLKLTKLTAKIEHVSPTAWHTHLHIFCDPTKVSLPRFILESVIHDYPWKSNQIQKADTERWYISSSQGSIHFIHLRPQPWDPWARLNAAWSNGSMALRRANKALAKGGMTDIRTCWQPENVGYWMMLEYVGCVLDMFLDFHWYVHPLDWELNGSPPFFLGKFNPQPRLISNDGDWGAPIMIMVTLLCQYPSIRTRPSKRVMMSGNWLLPKKKTYVFTLHWMGMWIENLPKT